MYTVIFELISVKKNVWKYKPMIFRNVSDTTRLVPQLRTVAREMALPLTEAGKISLRINQDTVKVNKSKQIRINQETVKVNQSVTIHVSNQLTKVFQTYNTIQYKYLYNLKSFK